VDTILIAWASVVGAAVAVAGLVRSVRRASREHDTTEREQYTRALKDSYDRGYAAGLKDAKAEQRERERDTRIAQLEAQLKHRERGQ
jgi:flagellar biosynthesis/type III secretory pathway protein FliH